MPELPEVETVLRGIKPVLCHQKIQQVIVRQPHLRYPVPVSLHETITEQTVQDISRRGKYLLFQLDTGGLILHLGMSGQLRLLAKHQAPGPHDHIDIHFSRSPSLRFTDPRRFGALLWTKDDLLSHPLLASIGPEPFTPAFNGAYLWEKAQKRKIPVKSFIMDSRIVAGIGNIYAAEALFLAGIRPQKPAGRVTLSSYELLVRAIQQVLKKAIQKGGTTLKDFIHSDGSCGYFSIELNVYGQAGKPCINCRHKLKFIQIGQRSTVYCSHCQQ